MKDIPVEYQLKCNGCSKILDMRDINTLLHGWIENGEIICYNEAEPIPYTSSKKTGEAIEWLHNKTPINLN